MNKLPSNLSAEMIKATVVSKVKAILLMSKNVTKK